MIWQDIVIAAGQFAFIVALLPSIFGPQKPHRSTSLLTAAVLTGFALTFVTLDFVWSAAMCGLAAAGWWILFWQGINVVPINEQEKT